MMARCFTGLWLAESAQSHTCFCRIVFLFCPSFAVYITASVIKLLRTMKHHRADIKWLALRLVCRIWIHHLYSTAATLQRMASALHRAHTIFHECLTSPMYVLCFSPTDNDSHVSLRSLSCETNKTRQALVFKNHASVNTWSVIGYSAITWKLTVLL